METLKSKLPLVIIVAPWKLYSVSQKNLPWGHDILSFFCKWLKICNRFFAHRLYVPIFARLQIFIQLYPIMTTLWRTNNFPQKGRGLGHVNPKIFGIRFEHIFKTTELGTSNLVCSFVLGKPSGRTHIFHKKLRGLGQVTSKIFGIRSNISSKLLELGTSNLVHGFVWRMRSRRTKISPKTGRGLRHVTHTMKQYTVINCVRSVLYINKITNYSFVTIKIFILCCQQWDPRMWRISSYIHTDILQLRYYLQHTESLTFIWL